MASSNISEEYRVDIPTEVLYEIFHRLPTLQPVYRFRCVSKLWNSLLSEPSFINKIFNNISSTPWIFMYDPSDEPGQLYLNRDHKFINHHDGLSFEFLLDTCPFKTQEIEKACLLDSCSNGLVLYSVHPFEKDSSAAADADNMNTMFYICNPLTKQWVSLPRRPYNGSQDYYTQFMKLLCDTSTASLNHSLCNYKVVYIYYDFTDKTLSTAKVCFQIFSSDTRNWKTFEVPVSPTQMDDFSKMVIRHGVLYWKAQTRSSDEIFLIAYRLENTKNGSDRCRSIGIPKMSDGFIKKSFLGESQGSIYYGHIFIITDTGSHRRRYKVFLSVWQLEDDYTNGGLYLEMVHKNIELKGYRSTSFNIEDIYLNPVDKNVIIIVDRGCCLAYNIKTLTHEVLHGCPIPIKLEGYDSPPILITPKPTVIPFIEK